MVYCAYYHLLAQQIFVLQKGDVAFTFCNMNICCATNPLNLQRNIVGRQVAPKMLPVLLGLNTSNLVISRCCFADDGKEMDKNENRTAERGKLLFSPTKYADL